MWGLTTSDWIALASAAGTVLAALFAVAAVIYAAKSANASRDTAELMKEQWQQSKRDRAADDWGKEISLISSLRDECKVIRYTFTAGGQARLAMPEWEKSRTEVARIDKELASVLRELEMRIERLNESNKMNAEMMWHPVRDKLMADARNMTTLDEAPEMQARMEAFAGRKIAFMKGIYEPYMPMLDKVTAKLDAIYAHLEEHRPE